MNDSSVKINLINQGSGKVKFEAPEDGPEKPARKIPHPLRSSIDTPIDIIVTEVMQGILPHLKCLTCEEQLAVAHSKTLEPDVSNEADDEKDGEINVVTVDMNVSKRPQTSISTRKDTPTQTKNVSCEAWKQPGMCKRRSIRLKEKRAKRGKLIVSKSICDCAKVAV
ncbi:hypothetical protein QAD02_007412 [Eretmocerus hayati]|uniref:Uncharacterized protein n=1 Tax=Eretmocerus hayati TaxID=131215 RepID=A0ACC2N3J7_9HYME|nr:hypothetical protein QAD02_007412 [Eretmocerus hayati]